MTTTVGTEEDISGNPVLEAVSLSVFQSQVFSVARPIIRDRHCEMFGFLWSLHVTFFAPELPPEDQKTSPGRSKERFFSDSCAFPTYQFQPKFTCLFLLLSRIIESDPTSQIAAITPQHYWIDLLSAFRPARSSEGQDRTDPAFLLEPDFSMQARWYKQGIQPQSTLLLLGSKGRDWNPQEMLAKL